MVDVAIVGAGAAGLAAARRLTERRPDWSIRALEAEDRAGGRARTIAAPGLGVPLDLGCGWLHGAEHNPWLAIAGTFGFHVDRTPAPWDVQHQDLGFPPEDQRAYEAAAEAFDRRQTAAQADPADRPLGALLEPGNPWNGLLDAVSSYVSGAELGALSTHDSARYAVHGSDWRVSGGYGRLVVAYGAGLPVALGTPVTRIDHGGAGPVRLETPRGTLEARAVVVTVSTNLLADGAIRFDPPLPDKVAAARDLPLGLANKVFLHLAAPEALPADGHLIGNPRSARTGAYHLRPFGRPVIEVYIGGTLARELEQAGAEAAAAFALDELAGLLGDEFRRQASPLTTTTTWGRTATVRGSYAYAKPGAAGQRAVLAAPVEGRLFFAGEATSPDAFTTARGAYESGLRAADEVLAALETAP
ncbi:FAD-dependent oxidoreductase [Methylobacterium sp. E-005]|uniref:flavin monoamine oxidase family protein n=1 Tax=Methylobacterium sp. E-005 TaxID=2836549 RepID=UPI001FB8E96E|nr:NAD(P)/FAD-dependent oxidoreductase [Methylobacterium sp. E-005]MCJ2086099.1 FAD-dependent oxidoreductase [Methylobacterium sp. E-005]